MEGITDPDYKYAKSLERFCNKSLGEHHDLYVQNNSLLLADTFESIRNKCIEK